jgi:hypothetical protein
MHDVVLGFVCFMAGVFFAIAVGFIALGRMPIRGRPGDASEHTVSDPAGLRVDLRPPPPSPPKRRPWRDAEPHPAWPECECPSEAFHAKYYPAAGVRN